jgi:hypothetical protein
MHRAAWRQERESRCTVSNDHSPPSGVIQRCLFSLYHSIPLVPSYRLLPRMLYSSQCLSQSVSIRCSSSSGNAPPRRHWVDYHGSTPSSYIYSSLARIDYATRQRSSPRPMLEGIFWMFHLFMKLPLKYVVIIESNHLPRTHRQALMTLCTHVSNNVCVSTYIVRSPRFSQSLRAKAS